MAGALGDVWEVARLAAKRPFRGGLHAYDSSTRFDVGDGRRSTFSDEEIDQALNGIGPAALPCLREWLTAKPSRLKSRLNQLLNQQRWIRFRFAHDVPNLQGLAEAGFMRYGPEAQPLLPDLIRMSHSRDPKTRMIAYEAAFFTRPNREIFLPLAYAALKEEDKGVREMAAQWMTERFPADAEKAGLLNRFPYRAVSEAGYETQFQGTVFVERRAAGDKHLIPSAHGLVVEQHHPLAALPGAVGHMATVRTESDFAGNPVDGWTWNPVEKDNYYFGGMIRSLQVARMKGE